MQAGPAQLINPQEGIRKVPAAPSEGQVEGAGVAIAQIQTSRRKVGSLQRDGARRIGTVAAAAGGDAMAGHHAGAIPAQALWIQDGPLQGRPRAEGPITCRLGAGG